MIDFALGFAACAVVMTLFPSVALKINGAVRVGLEYAKAQYTAWKDRRAAKAKQP